MTTVKQLQKQVDDKNLGRVINVAGSMAGPGFIVGFALISMAALAITMSLYSYDVWAAFWIAPALMLACIPIANGAAKAEGDAAVGRFILAAAFIKVVFGAFARFATLAVAYDGGGDSERYHAAGKVLAPTFRQLDFADLGKISGTRFIEVLTGVIYAITGATELGGFLVYSFLSFLGMYWFYRAFVIAFPEGDRVRYRLLLFLFPTMWFWPSSIGKDAFMIFVLGMATYGFARALDGDLRGLALTGLGMWGAIVVRPHLAAIFVIAAGVATLVRVIVGRNTSVLPGRRTGGRAGAIMLAVVVGVAAIAASAQVQDRFNLDSLDVESAESVLTETTRRTSQGGAEFSAASPRTPVGFALAAITVQFRPFPIEAVNVQSFATSLEGLLLLALCMLAIGRARRTPRVARQSPLVAFAVIWALTFIYAFAAIENFGILARQRAQLFPLLFVLLAISSASQTDDASVDQVQS